MTKEEIIDELENIINNVGDTMDRQGDYISDNIYKLIEKIEKG